MAVSDYVARLRACVGHDLLILPAAGACLRDEAGRILLLRQRDGLWSVPGGGMEPGERLDQAAVREVREETGLEVEPVALIGVYSDPAYITCSFKTYLLARASVAWRALPDAKASG